MEHKQYTVDQHELIAIAKWGDNRKLRDVFTRSEKHVLYRMVKKYDDFKIDLQSVIVYASKQNQDYHNIDPLLNLWAILDSKVLLKGVRKNLIKDYLIENCGVSLSEDGKLYMNKEDIKWTVISETPWWETVKSGMDLSKYELEAMVAKFDTLIKFSQGQKVTEEAKDGLKYHILKKLGVVEQESKVEPIERVFKPRMKRVG